MCHQFQVMRIYFTVVLCPAPFVLPNALSEGWPPPLRQNEAERMLMSHFPCVFFTSCSSETMCCLSIWAYHKRFNSQTIWCQSFYGFAGINRKKGVENSSPEAHSPKTIEKSLQSCPGWPPATSSEFPCSFELLNLQMLSLWEAS